MLYYKLGICVDTPITHQRCMHMLQRVQRVTFTGHYFGVCIALDNIYLFYLTSSDAKTVRRASWLVKMVMLSISIRNILQPTRSLYGFRLNSYVSNSGFHAFGDLDIDLCSIFCHTRWDTGISMRSFIRIRPVVMGDMPRTHTRKHVRTHARTHTRTEFRCAAPEFEKKSLFI